MGRAFAMVFLSAWVAGCRCGPDVPTPVTLRLKNTTRDALFVNDSDGRAGLRVQRHVNGEWLPFVERPQCECLACDEVCRGCACDAGTPAPLVRKLAAGQSYERVWEGSVQVSATGACSGGIIAGPACLRPENPALDETFRLELCYSPEAPGVQDLDGGPVPGVLPAKSTLCVFRDFKPLDGVVEVSPSRGADCTSHPDCQGAGELCFGGGCTTACPASGFPEVGAAWGVRVQEPDDQGFFTVEPLDGGKLYRGTGKMGSVLYQNGTMTVRLSRAGLDGGTLGTGAVYLTLPPGYSVPLAAGRSVVVKLVDRSSAQAYGNRALTMRELDGGLVLAADSAQSGALLSPGETAPFTVEPEPAIVGCQNDDCGKRLYFATRFSGGQAPVSVEPGSAAIQVAAGAAYQLLNVTDYRYDSTRCEIETMAPYAILRQGP